MVDNEKQIKQWCSENLFLLKKVSDLMMSSWMTNGKKDRVSIQFVGTMVPFQERDANYLERVLTLMGYTDSKVEFFEEQHSAFQAFAIDFSWSYVEDSERWLEEFLLQEKQNNAYWLNIQ